MSRIRNALTAGIALLSTLWGPATWALPTLEDAPFVAEWGLRSPRLPGLFDFTISNAVDDVTGDVYTVESTRVQKFDRDGNFILEWPCEGCNGIDVNSVTHDVYLSRSAHRIIQYTSSGVSIREWGSFGSGQAQFISPHGVSVDSVTGNVYIADTGNGRIQVFGSNGAFVRQIGSPGNGDGTFSGLPSPAGIAFDPAARVVYATDPPRQELQSFDEFGTFLQRWGGLGVLPGQFRWPRSVAVDSEGRVYVTDTDSERIQYFTSDGIFIGSFQGPHTRAQGPFHPRDIAINLNTDEKYVNAAYAFREDKFDASNNYVLSWGGRVLNGSYLYAPRGIATSPKTGDVYVFDSGHFLVKRFSAGGAFLSQWGGSLRLGFTQPGLFGFVVESALTVDPDGSVWTGLIGTQYATDPDMMFVQKFDPDGEHLLSFFRPALPFTHAEEIRDLAIDPISRDIWVSDSFLNKLWKFDLVGNPLLEIDDVGVPAGIAFHSGNIYLVDRESSEVRKYDTNGRLHVRWGGLGSGDGNFHFGGSFLGGSSGIDTDSSGNVYVADTSNYRIQQFDPNGVFMGKRGALGSGPAQFNLPMDVALSPADDILYIADTYNHRVQAICLTQVNLCISLMDFDADGHIDAQDNCPFTSNATQDDSGGLDSPDMDGIGDQCQCGDSNRDGRVAGSDLTLIRQHISSFKSLIDPELCSVAGATECNILDAVILQRALAALEPGISQVCTAAVRAPAMLP